MLGRYQHRNFAAISFEEARPQLSELLSDFGPPSTGQPNVLDPFWRLQNDKVWRVEDLGGARIAETVTPPNLGTLVDRKARGNFTDDIGMALRQQPAYIGRLADEMLAAHFPRSLHDDICAAVGIDVSRPVEATPVEVNRRDAEFRPRIIRAYEHRCAATGWDLRIGHTDAGLEAAHIKWHTFGRAICRDEWPRPQFASSQTFRSRRVHIVTRRSHPAHSGFARSSRRRRSP